MLQTSHEAEETENFKKFLALQEGRKNELMKESNALIFGNIGLNGQHDDDLFEVAQSS